jgi:deoxyuridine 5'-triphosphate nucleotidohydrolase
MKMNNTLILKIYLKDSKCKPTTGRLGDAGIDCYYSGDNIELHQNDVIKIPLGFHCSLWAEEFVGEDVINGAGCGIYQERLTEDYWIEIKNRSGVGIKKGLVNLAGVVDSNYRGELQYCCSKVTSTPAKIDRYEKICQILVHPFVNPQNIEIRLVNSLEELGDTDRGVNGFGSSG